MRIGYAVKEGEIKQDGIGEYQGAREEWKATKTGRGDCFGCFTKEAKEEKIDGR